MFWVCKLLAQAPDTAQSEKRDVSLAAPTVLIVNLALPCSETLQAYLLDAGLSN